MPTHDEQENEDGIREIESKAAEKVSSDAAGAAKGYEEAALKWADTSDAYFRESQDDRHTEWGDAEYRCRAGAAWLRAARDFEAAAALTKDPTKKADLQESANKAFKHAGQNYEACAGARTELDDPEGARAALVQADSCYLFWKYGLKKVDPNDVEIETADLVRKRIREELEKARRKARKKIKEANQSAPQAPAVPKGDH